MIKEQITAYNKYLLRIDKGQVARLDTDPDEDIFFFIEINSKRNHDDILVQSDTFDNVSGALEWLRSTGYINQEKCNIWLMSQRDTDGDIDYVAEVNYGLLWRSTDKL